MPCSQKYKPERPISPSVRALLSNKDKMKDKSYLLNPVLDKEETNLYEKSQTTIESNTIKKTFSLSNEDSMSAAGEKSEEVDKE